MSGRRRGSGRVVGKNTSSLANKSHQYGGGKSKKKRGKVLLYTTFRADPEPWETSPPRTPPSTDEENENNEKNETNGGNDCNTSMNNKDTPINYAENRINVNKNGQYMDPTFGAFEKKYSKADDEAKWEKYMWRRQENYYDNIPYSSNNGDYNDYYNNQGYNYNDGNNNGNENDFDRRNELEDVKNGENGENEASGNELDIVTERKDSEMSDYFYTQSVISDLPIEDCPNSLQITKPVPKALDTCETEEKDIMSVENGYNGYIGYTGYTECSDYNGKNEKNENNQDCDEDGLSSIISPVCSLGRHAQGKAPQKPKKGKNENKQEESEIIVRTRKSEEKLNDDMEMTTTMMMSPSLAATSPLVSLMMLDQQQHQKEQLNDNSDNSSNFDDSSFDFGIATARAPPKPSMVDKKLKRKRLKQTEKEEKNDVIDTSQEKNRFDSMHHIESINERALKYSHIGKNVSRKKGDGKVKSHRNRKSKHGSDSSKSKSKSKSKSSKNSESNRNNISITMSRLFDSNENDNDSMMDESRLNAANLRILEKEEEERRNVERFGMIAPKRLAIEKVPRASDVMTNAPCSSAQSSVAPSIAASVAPSVGPSVAPSVAGSSAASTGTSTVASSMTASTVASFTPHLYMQHYKYSPYKDGKNENGGLTAEAIARARIGLPSHGRKARNSDTKSMASSTVASTVASTARSSTTASTRASTTASTASTRASTVASTRTESTRNSKSSIGSSVGTSVGSSVGRLLDHIENVNLNRFYFSRRTRMDTVSPQSNVYGGYANPTYAHNFGLPLNHSRPSHTLNQNQPRHIHSQNSFSPSNANDNRNDDRNDTLNDNLNDNLIGNVNGNVTGNVNGNMDNNRDNGENNRKSRNGASMYHVSNANYCDMDMNEIVSNMHKTASPSPAAAAAMSRSRWASGDDN